MLVYKCNLCGVEYLDSHTTCPFCRADKLEAKCVGYYDSSYKSKDFYEPCDTDGTRCEEEHKDTVNLTSMNMNDTPKYIYDNRETSGVANRGVINLILGVLTLVIGLPVGILNMILYFFTNKDTWSDEERRSAKVGVLTSSIVVVGYLLFFIIFLCCMIVPIYLGA